jgi:hypothetical protein
LHFDTGIGNWEFGIGLASWLVFSDQTPGTILTSSSCPSPAEKEAKFVFYYE